MVPGKSLMSGVYCSGKQEKHHSVVFSGKKCFFPGKALSSAICPAIPVSQQAVRSFLQDVYWVECLNDGPFAPWRKAHSGTLSILMRM
ncbi:MAG: hypothetical protein ACOY32_00955 [Thermodesulfobacteriota bacterium]